MVYINVSVKLRRSSKAELGTNIPLLAREHSEPRARYQHENVSKSTARASAATTKNCSIHAMFFNSPSVCSIDRWKIMCMLEGLQLRSRILNWKHGKGADCAIASSMTQGRRFDDCDRKIPKRAGAELWRARSGALMSSLTQSFHILLSVDAE